MAVPNMDITPAIRALHQKLVHYPESFAVVVAGPSGVGKTTMCRRILDLNMDLRIRRCVTSTTRSKREGEVDGVERHFITEEAFLLGIQQGIFVEHARVHGYWYGATLDAVFEALSDGHVMLMDVDVQGVETWKQVLIGRCVTVFVLPPSLDILATRLHERQSETHEAFQLRMENAIQELQKAGTYDYLIVNDVLDRAVDDLQVIVRAEQNRTHRLRRLLSDLGVD
jgi:guanylate kinase